MIRRYVHNYAIPRMSQFVLYIPEGFEVLGAFALKDDEPFWIVGEDSFISVLIPEDDGGLKNMVSVMFFIFEPEQSIDDGNLKYIATFKADFEGNRCFLFYMDLRKERRLIEEFTDDVMRHPIQ